MRLDYSSVFRILVKSCCVVNLSKKIKKGFVYDKNWKNQFNAGHEYQNKTIKIKS